MIVLPRKPTVQEKQIEKLAVNSRDAATMLGVSERTIFKLTKEKRISRIKIGWRSLYPIASLKTFLEASNDE